MNQEFGHPVYGAGGFQVLPTADGLYADALINASVYRLAAGGGKGIFSPTKSAPFC